ncbi:MAG: PHB depolymerase family esterase, partial [Zoogloeaceae bacterium]|nr:PHB depolymerase family esterase [Zoogloeaceae bacterium]
MKKTLNPSQPFGRNLPTKNPLFCLRYALPCLLLALGGWQNSATAETHSPAPSSLPALKADAKNVTVSGLSSGAFMAVQFHVAHSSVVRGVGVLAGGPYYCAQGSAGWAIPSCMSPNLFMPLPNLEKLLREVRTQAAAKRIDD